MSMWGVNLFFWILSLWMVLYGGEVTQALIHYLNK